MAARRLIAILLVLLFLSSLAAALAPVQQTEESSSSSTTDTSTTDATAGSSTQSETSNGAPALINQSVDAALEKAPLIRARTGDQLQLRVTSQKTGTVELVGIGPTEDVGPQQPAFFDVLLRDPGTHPVRFLETGREIAKIKVSAKQPAAPSR